MKKLGKYIENALFLLFFIIIAVAISDIFNWPYSEETIIEIVVKYFLYGLIAINFLVYISLFFFGAQKSNDEIKDYAFNKGGQILVFIMASIYLLILILMENY